MVVTGGSAAVVVSAGAGAFGEHGEGPPVAGVAEALVSDQASPDLAAAPRGAGDGGGASERAQTAGGGEAVAVITDLSQDSGRKDGAEAGRGAKDGSQRVFVELAAEGLLELLDGGLHRDDDREQPSCGVTECCLDRR